MNWGFLLSHQHPEHLDRCIRIGGVPFCSRCLGLYPTLALGLLGLFLLGGVFPAGEEEGSYLTLLCLPALLDWSYSLFHPRPEGKLRRLLTGVLLGLGLSRTLWIHFQAPFSRPVLDVLGVLAAGAFLAGVLRWRLGAPEPEPGPSHLDGSRPPDR
ncbi:MAG: DUF2085 domain-containing protein [Deltaproteobacteria bacterium]|nr:DUF2085 domain-containing protein [Deltaproteobacteria bacterium]